MKRLISLTIAIGLVAGCTSQHPSEPAKTDVAAFEKYALELRDRLGNPVGVGDLELPSPIPTEGGSFQGGWHLNSSLDFGPSIARCGKYDGTIAGGLFSFNLSPDVPDDDVHLAGLLVDGSIQGRWTHQTLGGEREMGQFILRPAQPKP